MPTPNQPHTAGASTSGRAAAGTAAGRAGCLERPRGNARALAGCGAALADPATATAALDRIGSIAHTISGGGAIFGFVAMSRLAADLEAADHHDASPAATAASGPWQGRLTGIASEWSPQFPGYVAGAIEAAGLGVQSLDQKA